MIVDNVIDALDDAAVTVTTGSTPTIVPGTVITNDTINGVAVTTANTDVTVSTSGPLSIDADGVITVAPNTPSGTYTITYELCETGATPANCDTAVATVIVDNVIDALDDATVTVEINVSGSIFATNVLGNDTINGVPVTIVNTGTTPSTQGPLTIDTDGNITIADGTAAGTYIFTYELCETGAVPANCDTATVIIVVITDSDGDGVSNIDEITDGTDPDDFCDFIPTSVTEIQSSEFLNADCDNDGLTNGEEYGPTPTNPLDSDGDGTPDFLEPNNHQPSEDDLEIYNLVTPNGDNDNDVFTIRNIELFPDNTIEIYNRWGVLVYETRGYGQNGNYFRGISEGRVTISQSSELPVGTYFYVLKYRNNSGVSRERSGYLYINR